MERKIVQSFGKKRGAVFLFFILIGGVLLTVGLLLSISAGAANVSVEALIEVLKNYDPTNPSHVLITSMRVPRVIAAGLVGASLGVAGAMMQGLTRNPLGDSGLMGISSGAVFVVALSYGFYTSVNYTSLLVFAFLGSAAAAALVYLISYLAPGGNHPMKLILAGAALTSLLSALSQGIAILTDVTQSVSFWTMGSVAGIQWKHIAVAAPVMGLAMFVAMMMSGSITLISMGDEVAGSLGLKVRLVRMVGLTVVVLLSGVSVAVAGMIAFVGLMVPHFCRYIVGPDYRFIIPGSALYGALLLVLADIGSKTINPPTEIPIGAVVAVVGVPVFLIIAKNRKGA